MNKIEKAWSNVFSLAQTSDYYKHDRDSDDIELIHQLVEKATPNKPINNNDILKCPRCHKELNCGYAICLCNTEKEPLIVRDGSSYDYCPNCSQAIDWGEIK